MKRIALEQARERLEAAAISCEALRTSTEFKSTERAWIDFLLAASTIYSKLEQGSKTFGPSNGWFGRKKHHRKTDPLLIYIHQARNTHEHGIVPITVRDHGGIALQGVGEGPHSFTGDMSLIGGVLTVIQTGGTPVMLHKTPARSKLTTVTNYGIEYPVPNFHNEVPIDGRDPYIVASVALDYLSKLLDEANQLPISD